jgi:hypothetical protein
MKVYAKEVWSIDPILKKWAGEEPFRDRACRCGNTKNQIELIGQSDCIVGRIDTTICTECNTIVSFDIVR